ncbi:uncharacterized protein LOC134291048 [Aedes albopictus]|uniref:Reverse transcriptase domain-containing protein n=1 Tax=Aedes albopictus TaxID=7160 RepID=A0ABM1ZHD1_AEDAL
MKAARLRNRRLFLLNCRRTKIVPNCLNFDLTLDVENGESSVKLEKVVKKFKLKVVSVLIADCQRSLQKIKTSSASLRRQIDHALVQEDSTFFDACVKRKEESLYRQCNARETAKMDRLKTAKVCQMHKQDSWVANYSGSELPDFLVRTLQLGGNFNIPDRKNAPYVRMLSEIENCIQWDPHAETIRNDLCNAFINHINFIKQPFHDESEWIRKEMEKSRKFLRERTDLVITRADKGKQVVVITREEYDRKMNELVNDEETYEKVSRDPTMKTLRKINSMLDLWGREEWIDQATKHRLKIYHCNPPRIYGLPKTHKEDRPLRIICSTIGTVTYKCAKYVSSILNNIVGKTACHIVNSFDFVKEMRNVTIRNDTILVSLDVVSLFTNVPVDFAVESVMLRWEEIQEFTSIPKENFEEMLSLLLSSTFFQHQNQFFKQKFGVPMGSPLSPVVANITLERIESNALELLKQEDIIPIFFKRYVDDCLMAIRRQDISRIVEVFNSYHPRLQFTVEIEENGRLKFLDTIMRRTEKGITLEWTPKDVNGRFEDVEQE